MTVWAEKLPDRPHYVLRWIDAAGRQRQRATDTARRDQAVRLAVAWEADLRAGPARDLTWPEFAAVYTAERMEALALRTRRHWQSVLAALDDYGPPARLADVDARYLAGFTAWLLRPREIAPRKPDGQPRTKTTAPATAESYLKRLLAALHWAAEQRLVAAAPRRPKIERRNKSRRARGRDLTAEEFDRFRLAVRKLYPRRMARALNRLLRGLWTSGLRLEEAIGLHWTREDRIRPVRLDHPRLKPLLALPWHRQKSKREETIPCAPEFAAFLRTCPPARRRGPVFRLCGATGQRLRDRDYLGKLIARAGKAAGIIVHRYADGRPKYATAHDLRRSFAQRWADRGLNEFELQALMRHRSSETTRQYYLDHSADRLAGRLAELTEANP